jgi:hypothetical protein
MKTKTIFEEKENITITEITNVMNDTVVLI